MMRSIPLSLLVVAVITHASLVRITESSSTGNLLTAERVAAFHEWVDVHGKEYETNVEMNQRLMTWVENDGTSYMFHTFIAIEYTGESCSHSDTSLYSTYQ